MSVQSRWSEWIESGKWAESSDAAISMLPALAADVMNLAMDPDVGIVKLAHVVAKDQALATRVLRLANSASSAAMQEITTVNDAIVRIGTEPVRKVVLAVCVTSQMDGVNVPGAQGRALRDHAIGTAYLARLIAERVGVDTDEAFMFGLLHDLGKLVLLKLVGDFTKTGAPAPSAEEIECVFRDQHAEVGARLLRHWKLSAALENPVRYHHNPDASPSHQAEATVAYVANRLSHRYGFGCPPDDGPILEDPVCMQMGVNTSWLEDVDKRAPGLFDIARQIGR